MKQDKMMIHPHHAEQDNPIQSIRRLHHKNQEISMRLIFIYRQIAHI